jgi:hypothetical protein
MSETPRRPVGHTYYRNVIYGNARVHMGDVIHEAPGTGSLMIAVFAGNVISSSMGYALSWLLGSKSLHHRLSENDPQVIEQLARQAAELGNCSLAEAFIETSIAVDKLRRLDTDRARDELYRRWETREELAIFELQRSYNDAYTRILKPITGQEPGRFLLDEISYGKDRPASSGNEIDDIEDRNNCAEVNMSVDAQSKNISSETHATDTKATVLDSSIVTRLKRVKFWPFRVDERGQPKAHSWQYTRPIDPASFFVVGRVFTVPWDVKWDQPTVPAQVSELRGLATYDRRTDTSFLNFLVILPLPYQSCYCLPLSSYRGKGTTRLSNKKQRNTHSIIYAPSMREPKLIEDEKKFDLDPIKVCMQQLHSPEQTLEIGSRLNLAEAFPVAWDLAVKELGTVEPDCMKRLMTYWLNYVATSLVHSSEM